MSKQNMTKGGAPPRKTGNNPAQTRNKQGSYSASSKGATSGTSTNRPANGAYTNRAGAQARPRAVQAKSKGGFRLRPLDIALILAGVLIVGFIVFSAFQVPPVQVDAGAGVSSDATHVPVGQVAPDFTVQNIDGSNYTLSEHNGDVRVLEFMATWCPHCQEETPVYNQIYDTYVSTGKPVEMMGINATPRGHDNTSPATVDDLKWFRDNMGAKYPLMFDKALASAQAYGVLSYPSVYIVDQNGKVAFEPPTDSLPTYDQLAAKIDELLK